MGSSGLGGLLRFRMSRSIGLIRAHPAHPKNLRMSSDQVVVKYGILQLPGSDELGTHVARPRPRSTRTEPAARPGGSGSAGALDNMSDVISFLVHVHCTVDNQGGGFPRLEQRDRSV